MTCTRCSTTGFLNLHQVPANVLAEFDSTGDHAIILRWIRENDEHDVTVCDCCGDTDGWYGEPGHHDHKDCGKNGPYAYNGGLPECH